MFKKILFLIALLLDSEALTPHLFGAQDKTSYEIIQEWDPQTSIHHGPHQAQEWIRKCHDLYPTLFDDPQNDPRYLKVSLINDVRYAVQIQQRIIQAHNQNNPWQKIKETPAITIDHPDKGLHIPNLATMCNHDIVAAIEAKESVNLYRLIARCGLLSLGCFSTAYILYNKAKQELLAEDIRNKLNDLISNIEKNLHESKETLLVAEINSIEQALEAAKIALKSNAEDVNLLQKAYADLIQVFPNNTGSLLGLKEISAKAIRARILHNIHTKQLNEQISVRKVALFFTLCTVFEFFSQFNERTIQLDGGRTSFLQRAYNLIQAVLIN